MTTASVGPRAPDLHVFLKKRSSLPNICEVFGQLFLKTDGFQVHVSGKLTFCNAQLLGNLDSFGFAMRSFLFTVPCLGSLLKSSKTVWSHVCFEPRASVALIRTDTTQVDQVLYSLYLENRRK